jgi:hypothetical protein
MTNNKQTIIGNSEFDVIFSNNYVFKKSTSIENSKRLKLQYNKHCFYNTKENKKFSCPKIIDHGEEHKLFWYKMEFIFFNTFEKFLIISNKKLLNKISYNLCGFIENNIDGYKEISSDVFIQKFESTKNKIYCKFDNNIEYINEFMYDIDDKMTLPYGFCHGDLTFSNMLFDNNGEICVLDFLDNFIDSPLFDLIKIKQDTKFYWSLNLIREKTDFLKIKQNLNYINNCISENFKNSNIMNYYCKFEILNLIRILPYCKNKNIFNFILSNIRELIKCQIH